MPERETSFLPTYARSSPSVHFNDKACEKSMQGVVSGTRFNWMMREREASFLRMPDLILFDRASQKIYGFCR